MRNEDLAYSIEGLSLRRGRGQVVRKDMSEVGDTHAILVNNNDSSTRPCGWWATRSK